MQKSIANSIIAEVNAINGFLNFKLNKKAINGERAQISAKDSSIKIFVIPTNEEIVIARETFLKMQKFNQ